MLDFKGLEGRIQPPDAAAARQARARWNAVAKPLGALGALEDAIVRIAACTGTADVALEKRCVAVFCADNGVVAEGVSQCGSEVTSAVARNLAAGTSSVCMLANSARVDVVPVDVGMCRAVPGVRDMRVAAGTADIACAPAMTHAQACAAMGAGLQVAADLAGQGYALVCAGEMGIGNTTTAAACAAALLGLPAREVVGRGAGLSDEGLARKRTVVETALSLHASRQPLDVLANLGGFDIAALAGLYLGCALHRVPVVVDGFIGAVAALLAVRLCPSCKAALLASHVSSEPAAGAVLAELGLSAIITAGMHLGEGAGAVCLVPLLDAALALYRGTTFAQTGIAPYKELL